MAKRYDWVKIKALFLKSTLSVEEFAKEQGIPYGTIKPRVTKEKWIETRSATREQMIQRTIQKNIENNAEKLASFDEECLEIATKILRKSGQMVLEADAPHALRAISGTLFLLALSFALAY